MPFRVTTSAIPKDEISPAYQAWIGHRVGNLILRRPFRKGSHVWFHCECDCGNTCTRQASQTSGLRLGERSYCKNCRGKKEPLIDWADVIQNEADWIREHRR